jgi:hypothetical protein
VPYLGNHGLWLALQSFFFCVASRWRLSGVVTGEKIPGFHRITISHDGKRF